MIIGLKVHPVTLKGKIRAWGEFLATAWEICIKKYNRFFDRVKTFYLKGSDYYIRRGKATLVTYLLIIASLLGLFKLILQAFA